MPVLGSLLYLLCHALAILALPSHARTLSFAFLIVVPLLAAWACSLRLRSQWRAGWSSWGAVALAMLLWSAAVVVSLREELFLHDTDLNPGGSMLLYVLYGVPLTFAVANAGREAWYVHVIDAVLAGLLGYLYFVHTFSLATSSAEGLRSLRLMFDLENIFIAGFSVLRYLTSIDRQRRHFFRTLSWFSLAYLLAAGYTNHVLADDVDFGTLSDLVVDVPFLLLYAAARLPSRRIGELTPSRRLAYVVRAASPAILPVTLLTVSGVMARTHLSLSIVGFVASAFGLGLRGVLSQVRAYEERDRLGDLASRDALTGLLNRRSFEDRLLRAWRELAQSPRGMALLMIDVDHFKALNDLYGHQIGDTRLLAVANVLSSYAETRQGSAARYGGEEFAILLPAKTPMEAVRHGEGIRAAIEAMALPSPDGVLTVSVGVAHIELPGQMTPLALMALADQGLYDAKHGGRNRVAFVAQREGRRAG